MDGLQKARHELHVNGGIRFRLTVLLSLRPSYATSAHINPTISHGMFEKPANLWWQRALGWQVMPTPCPT